MYLEQIAAHVAEQSPSERSKLVRELRVCDGTIDVIHILHGARDCESLLFPS
jgi:plasmid stabilization system protein ParE